MTPLRKGSLVWLPNGRPGRVTVYDPANHHIEVGPLPWYTRAVRYLLGKPSYSPRLDQYSRLKSAPLTSCPKGHGTDV